jgi:syntaxin 5
MKASKDRTEQFMHTASQSALPAPSNSKSQLTTKLISDSLLFNQTPSGSRPGSAPGFPPDKKGKARAIPDNQYPNGESGEGSKETDFLALDIDGDRGESGMIRNDGQGGFQQMQMVEQQVGHLQRKD